MREALHLERGLVHVRQVGGLRVRKAVGVVTRYAHGDGRDGGMGTLQGACRGVLGGIECGGRTGGSTAALEPDVLAMGSLPARRAIQVAIPHTLADRVARPRTGRAGQGQLGHPSVPAWAQQADNRLSAARRRMLGPKRARSTGSIQSRTAASRSSAIILPPPAIRAGGRSFSRRASGGNHASFLGEKVPYQIP